MLSGQLKMERMPNQGFQALWQEGSREEPIKESTKLPTASANETFEQKEAGLPGKTRYRQVNKHCAYDHWHGLWMPELAQLKCFAGDRLFHLASVK